MPVCWQITLQIRKLPSMERVNIMVNEGVFKNNNYTRHYNYIVLVHNPKRTQRPFAKGDLSVNTKPNVCSF